MENDSDTMVEQLKKAVRKFVHDRAWEKYQNPKDLAESICIEAAEMLELFQWITPDEALSWKDETSKVRHIQEELADIIIYGLGMANIMKIDVTKVVVAKLESNAMKYPVEQYYGRATPKSKVRCR